jgi:hypothetical protein
MSRAAGIRMGRDKAFIKLWLRSARVDFMYQVLDNMGSKILLHIMSRAWLIGDQHKLTEDKREYSNLD